MGDKEGGRSKKIKGEKKGRRKEGERGGERRGDGVGDVRELGEK